MTISELYIYPIKSLSGISVSEVIVEEKGFRNDRRFMLVTPEGEFMTQRTYHQMALLDVAIQQSDVSDEVLRVWHRHNPDNVLELPLTGGNSTETMLVNIWDSKDVLAQTVSDEADQWFSAVLGNACRLVFMPETTQRAVDPKYALDNDMVSFADGYPYLLISQASLDCLNDRLPEPMSMLRFRPNVVVEGTTPYEEDSWAEFRMGDLEFYGVKPCARCVLTTIDPETGEKGKEPLRTLTTYRKWNAKILFGQNVLAKLTGNPVLGTLRIGQLTEVLRYQEAWLAPPALNA
ncbi:MOSC domain-containing protein [Spirosoma foliorum]|uniref:MOSC domain-containing protein n=1 Tax=Spirosoma foliorum TaxID=2710596 RepID=A0A7G5GYC5_9BACT|nr:MOSC N-terminal beta barrel domain-containing protein [Spirosoma foliorum]QMW03867.1 MOSC domain-containing protein [Spirosoma foliorum]